MAKDGKFSKVGDSTSGNAMADKAPMTLKDLVKAKTKKVTSEDAKASKEGMTLSDEYSSSSKSAKSVKSSKCSKAKSVKSSLILYVKAAKEE